MEEWALLFSEREVYGLMTSENRQVERL